MAENNLSLSADLTQVIKAVNDLSSAMEKLSKANKKAKDAGKELSDEERKLARETDLAAKTTKQLADAQWRLAQIKEAGKGQQESELRQLVKARSAYNAQVKVLQQQANAKAGLTSKTKEYNSSLMGTRALLGQVRGMLMQTFGAYAVFSSIKNTYNIVKEFEQAMARVKAITGATAEEFEYLSRMAKSISAKGSIFDPKTIAELQVELSKLGFTAREIGFATQPIVNLATATGEELAKSAQIAAATLRSFNLDASEMTNVIDVMSKSFTTSALDMSRWAEGAKYAAPVANQLGWSVENLGAVMGVLANRQIFGSMAGTSLRNIMAGIADTSSDLYKTLGLTSTNFDEFIEKLGEANAKGLDFGDILKLTEKRTTTSLLVLAKMTDEIKSFNDALNNANGAVKEMAEVQLTTLAAEAAKVTTAWKAFILELDEGNGIMSDVSKAVLKTLQDLIKSATLINQYGSDAMFWFVDAESETRTALSNIKKQNDEFIDSMKELNEEEKKAAASKEFERRLRLQQKYIKDLEKAELSLAKTREKLSIEESSSVSYEGKKEYVKQLKEEETRLQKIIYTTSDATEEYKRFADSMSSVVTSGYAKKTSEEIDTMFRELTESTLKYEKDIKDGVKFDFADFEEGKYLANLKKLEALSIIINARQSPVEKTKEEINAEIKALENKFLTQRDIEIAYANASKNFTEEERKRAISIAKENYEVQILMLKNKYEKDAEVVKLNELKITALMAEGAKEREDIIDDSESSRIKNSFKNANRLLDLQKKTNTYELELLRVHLDNLKKQLNEIPKENVSARRSLIDQILDAEFKIDQKTAQNRVDQVKAQLDAINTKLEEELGKGLERNFILKSMNVTEDDITELEQQYRIALERLSLVVKEVQPPEKRNLLRSLGLEITDSDIDILNQAIYSVTSSLQNLTNAWVESANNRVNASNSMVDQLQRDLQTELQLAEQGFASNVSLKRQQLEEEKRIRDQALRDQEAAQKKQLALQSILDAANIVSTIIKIAFVEGASKGIIGLGIAAVGATGLYALISSVKAKSKEITKYEKGGYEILRGNRHSNGGISLGEGREAEGGEMMSIFNRRATSKYSKEIAAFTDMLNKDKININANKVFSSASPSITVNTNSKKVERLLTDIRDNNTYYSNGYKIVKSGNRIRKVKKDGI